MACSLPHPNGNCSVLIQIPFNFSTPASLHQLHLTLKSWGYQLEVQNFVVNTLRQRESRLVLFCAHRLPQLCDAQVSVLLLQRCASFCKLSHLGRSIPPCDSSLRQFMLFDEDVLHCLEECAAFELTISATKQVQLPLRHGGLGLTSVSNHSSSAFISSLSNAIDVTSAPNASHHLKQVMALYNTKINSADAITFETVTGSPPQQHHLSGKIEDNSFQTLLINSTVCTRARLRAVSANNGNAWWRASPAFIMT